MRCAEVRRCVAPAVAAGWSPVVVRLSGGSAARRDAHVVLALGARPGHSRPDESRGAMMAKQPKTARSASPSSPTRCARSPSSLQIRATRVVAAGTLRRKSRRSCSRSSASASSRSSPSGLTARSSAGTPGLKRSPRFIAILAIRLWRGDAQSAESPREQKIDL
jgi:hypothetical protein